MLDLQGLRSVIAAAWQHGAQRVGLMRTLWELAGDCRSPVGVEIHAAPTAPLRWGINRLAQAKMASVPRDGVGATLTMTVRCRRCKECLAWRARLWTARAAAECRAASRTWFGTLTLGPAERFILVSKARQRRSLRGVDLDSESSEQRFRLMANEAGKELTKFFKRVRKDSGAPLRYIVVAEEHKSGDPHWHCLVHETHALQPVTKRVLQSQWRLGFSTWKLCDQVAARYVTKYLAKTMLARVRASIAYGETSFDIVKETLEFLERENPDPPQNTIVLGD